MKERRKYVRLAAAIGLTYQKLVKNKRQRTHQTLVRNISAGGLSFIAKDVLRQGDLLKLNIEIPHLAEPISAVGEVVWCSSSRQQDGHEAGVRFRDIEPEESNKILEYVHLVGIG